MDNKSLARSPVRLGFAMCGSFCTFQPVLEQMERLASDYEIQPILSETAYTTDTRFGTAEHFRIQIEGYCNKKILHTVREVEPIGPKELLDLLLIAPCTGNTLAKLANGISDSPVTLAAKAHLRNSRPVVIAVSSNDALSANAKNLGQLLNTRHLFFVPFRQDDPKQKPASLVADMSRIPETISLALQDIQIQPLLVC